MSNSADEQSKPASSGTGGADANPDAQPSADAPRRRRVRRRRVVARSKAQHGGAESESAPAEPRHRGRRRPAVAENGEDQRPQTSRAVDKTAKRRVYRQDVPSEVKSSATTTGGRVTSRATARPAQPAPAPPAASRTSRGAKPAAKPGATADKVTLILHPAPKAAPQRRRKKDGRPKTAREAMRAKAAKRNKGGAAKSPAPVEAAGEEDRSSELQEAWLTARGAAAVDAAKAAGQAVSRLVQAWQASDNADALAHVAATDTLSSNSRKAARRALNVLKSRGLEILHIRPTSPTPVRESAESCVATFVPADAAGICFFSFTSRQPSGRYLVADVMMSRDKGIVHASSGRIAGKHIRRWRNRVVERFGLAPVDVPLDWARHRVAEARKQNDEANSLVPLGFESCQQLAAPAPDEAPAHPLADLESDLSDKLTEAARVDSGKLHNDPEFRAWMPDKSAVDELLAKLGERLGPTGDSDDADKVEAAVREESAAATDRYFTPELRSVLAERMRDSAISVRMRADDVAATLVLATARAVREAGLITSPPRDVAFLSAFFDKAIAALLHRGGGKLTVPAPGASATTESG